MPFLKLFQFQQVTTAPRQPVITEDQWHQPWSIPARKRISAGLAIALLSSGLISPVIVPTEEIITVDKWSYPWSEPVQAKQIATALIPFSPAVTIVAPTPGPATDAYASLTVSNVSFEARFQHQGKAEPVFVPSSETVTEDKWHQALSEPVRQKVGLRPNLQQAVIAPVLNPETQISQTYESRWHQPWSEPVRQDRISTALVAFSQAAPVATIVTPAPGPATDVSAPLVLSNITVESRFQYQVKAEPVLVPTFDIGIQTFSSQVSFKGRFIYQTRAWPLPTPEVVTQDKWYQAFSEPVRQKPGLRAHLQQALIATTLDDETQIIQTYESRWHYPWSEPVRKKPGLAAHLQRYRAQGDIFAPEIVTADKWIYPWSEPVRQKIGLRANLQQAYIAPVLNPETQITQDIESRWHYSWSEPVRFRRFPAAEQQAFTLGVPSFEIVTADKWIYPWSEPVRQKPGLRASLQQALIQTVLDPETQIIQTYESRWHYAWSEPVRLKRGLGAYQQQVQAPSNIYPLEVIYEDKWHFPWSEPQRFKRGLPAYEQQFLVIDTAAIPTSQLETWFAPFSDPVRQKIGLKAGLQQAFIGTVLDPNTQITQDYESRWHQSWSEPVRFRRFQTAEQQFLAQPATSVFEIITLDKWIYPFNTPVRFKIDPKRAIALAAPFTTLVLNPNTQITQNYESRWHYPWSEPVRFRRFLAAEQQTLAFQQPIVEIITPDKWIYPWSEPKRFRAGLGAWLQQATVLETPPFQNFITTINWYAELSEPVRQPQGLKAWLQSFFAFYPAPAGIIPDVTVTLDATEVNSDSAFFGIEEYKPARKANVSIEEIQAIRTGNLSVEELDP